MSTNSETKQLSVVEEYSRRPQGIKDITIISLKFDIIHMIV